MSGEARSGGDRSYRLEPLDTSGVFLGLGVVQCVLLAGGLTTAVIAVSAGVPLPAAVVPVIAAGVASFARAGGHPVWEWLPLGVTWLSAAWGRRRRWAAPLPLWSDTDRAPPLPPCLAGLEVVEIPRRPHAGLGAVRDHERHTLTAVLPVRGGSFVIEPRAEQDRLLAAWGDVLGQFATERGMVAHLCWSDLTGPSGAGHHAAWLAAGAGERGAIRPAAERSYAELLDAVGASATAHAVVVAVTVSSQPRGRRPGHGQAAERLQRSLVSAVEALERGLGSAGLDVAEPLDPTGLHRLVRARIAPLPPARSTSGCRLAERLGLVTPASAGPLVVETGWDHVRVDAAWHRTWWVASWPRLPVPPSWLEPFLAATGVTRTMTVVFVPVASHRSRRRIERDLVKLDSDAAVKAEKGRRVDARHRRATEALLEREAELIAGHAEMAYVGLVTVSATCEDELDQHGEVIEQLAHEAGLELRVLDGRQDVAWAASLPLGLAPATLVAS
jgi:hypothetical protein